MKADFFFLDNKFYHAMNSDQNDSATKHEKNMQIPHKIFDVKIYLPGHVS